MITTETMAKIAVNKSLLKEYDTNEGRTVYLNNGDEFQIQLFNPNTEPIAASIWINDEKLNNQIIIRPGERIWLERYLDVAKKFKFETYEVEDNVTTEKAIAHNGEIKIQFFEKTKRYNQYVSAVSSPNIYYTSNNYCNTTGTATVLKDIYTDTFASTATLTTADDSIKTSSLLNTDVLNFDCDCDSIAVNASVNTVETGRIGEGSYSTQTFQSSNEEFNYWASKTETIKILPMSRKPYTSNDLEKIYCTECGRKLKTKFKYCPFCGTKIDY